jgi:transcriptional regulator with GAF, ATPase, and Fis domain/Tfp pilus assembly protein PilF
MTAHGGDERAADGAQPVTAESPEQLIQLGDVSSHSSDLRSAAAYYRRALARLPETGEARAATLRKLSYCLSRMGEPTDALGAIREAERLAGDETSVEERARVAIRHGWILMSAGHAEEAAARASAAQDLLRDRPTRVECGLASQLHGAIAYHLGETERAMQHYQAALKVFKEVGDLLRVGIVYLNIGLIHKRACNWSRALEHFQVAHNLLSTEGDYQNLPSVLQGLGVVHMKLGSFREAQEQFDRALQTSREIGDPLAMARAMLGQAEVLLRQQELAKARDLFREALERSLLHQFLRGTAIAYVGLSETALAEGNREDARRNAEKARDLTARMGGRGDQAIDLHLLLSALSLQENKREIAVEEAKAALEESRSSGDRIREARAMLAMALAQAASRDRKQADELLDGAEKILRRVSERYYLAEVLRVHGRLLLESDADRDRLKGLQLLLESRDAYRDMGLVVWEAQVLLDVAREDVRQRSVDRALERIETAKRLVAGHPVHEDQIGARHGELLRVVEESFASNAISSTESVDVRREMEAIVRSERTFDEKIADFLKVLVSAVRADGGCLIGSGEAEIRIVGAHGISSVDVGKRYRVPPAFRSSGWPASERPLVFLGLDDQRRATLAPLTQNRPTISAVAVPLRHAKDEWMILYVDRIAGSGARHFHQTEISFAIPLARLLAGFLEEAGLKNLRGLREMHRIEQNIALADIVTQNAEMQAILGLVSRVAGSNLSVLLQGETGTGKKLIASAIHQCSPRSGRAFVTVDCAALPESILESELFGYMKGAFTGALTDRPGILEQADGGTVFLDEIDKTGIAVQRRFLHLLDCGEIRAVGGRSYRSLDIRVVCATSSPDLSAEVASGVFLKDLYYRLNDVCVSVPPLRRRREDITLLAEYFLEVLKQEIGKEIAGISQIAMRKLVEYDWPGNVRELEKVMRRAATLADDGEMIGLDLLPSRLLEATDEEVPADPSGGTLKEQLEEIERRIVLRALEHHGWNKSRAASSLGLSRKGLKNKIFRYRLDRRTRRPPAP